MFGQCIFASHGGGEGGKESSSFWSDWVWDTTEGEGVGGIPSNGGNFFTKNQGFGCVINFKLTSNLARNVVWIAVQGVGGGGGLFLLSNVLDTIGEGVGGGIPSHGGNFLKFGY